MRCTTRRRIRSSGACRDDRGRRGSGRATLILGVVAAGSILAWLAWIELGDGGKPPRFSAVSASRETSAPGDAPAPSELDAGERRSATQPPAPSMPENAPRAAEKDWTSCLEIVEAEALRRCLAEHLGPNPDARAIARVLCGKSPSHQANRAAIAEALLRVPPGEAIAWIGPAEAECPRLLGWGDLENALEAIEARDPAWFSAFRQSMTPDVLFDPDSGEAGILFSVWFLKRGDLEMRTWIEKGAHGAWGGTSAQIDRAIGASLTIQRSGEEQLRFLRSVLEVPNIPGEAGIGSTFVNQLLNTRSWPEGQSSAALETLMQVLYEPRYEESAAATICLHFPVDAPPGCDPDMWAAIRARAIEVARAIGLVMPEAR